MKEIIDNLEFTPRIAVWELTLACNMRCLHCGSTAGKPREDELTTEEALSVCKQLVDLGCKEVHFLGGEPLLRKDWYILGDFLTKKGIKLTIITNGYFLNDEVIQKINKIKPYMVAISIDGPEETHDLIRTIKGSFKKTIQGYQILKKNTNSYVGAITHISKYNLNQIEDIYKVLIDNNVDCWQIQIGFSWGRLEKEYQINPSDLKRIIPFIVEKRKENKIYITCGDNIGYYTDWELELRPGEIKCWIGCFAGCIAIGIESNGNIKGCLSMPSTPEFIEGNIRKESLATIWNRKGTFKYNREFSKKDLKGFCSECRYGFICRAGCKTLAYTSTGSVGENIFCLHRVLEEEKKGFCNS